MPDSAIDAYPPGAPVQFPIDETIYLCSDELPYAIIYQSPNGPQPVRLEHSCDGEAGSGMDQFCVDGKVETVAVGRCSDAIWCEEVAFDELVTWNQQAFVEVTERCGDASIRREIVQQAPSGRYQAVVPVWKANQVQEKVVYEFVVGP